MNLKTEILLVLANTKNGNLCTRYWNYVRWITDGNWERRKKTIAIWKIIKKTNCHSSLGSMVTVKKKTSVPIIGEKTKGRKVDTRKRRKKNYDGDDKRKRKKVTRKHRVCQETRRSIKHEYDLHFAIFCPPTNTDNSDQQELKTHRKQKQHIQPNWRSKTNEWRNGEEIVKSNSRKEPKTKKTKQKLIQKES